MEVKVLRAGDDSDTTLGLIYIDGILKTASVEDEERDEKVSKETRIPCGKFLLDLRDEGGFHNRYKDKYDKKFGEGWHQGMICIYNSDDWKIVTDTMTFQYCLVHVGNTDEHTAGCLLPNYVMDIRNYKGQRSADAYESIYPEIRDAILKWRRGEGPQPTIEYIDIETGR